MQQLWDAFVVAGACLILLCSQVVAAAPPGGPQIVAFTHFATVRGGGPQKTANVKSSQQAAEETEAPLFRFGVISDVQYSSQRNGKSKSGKTRYYKDALRKLKLAMSHFREERTDFAVHLGDIIDGQNRMNSMSDVALQKVLDVMETGGCPMRHVLGNHCLYNHARPQLLQKLKIPPNNREEHCAYYGWVHKGFRFLVLDGYDVSSISWPPGHSKGLLARRILSYYNKNKHNWNSPLGLVGLERRYVAFGGGIGVAQFRWLEEQLNQAKEKGEKVVLFSHQALHPESADEICLLWNYDRVLGLINEYSDTVVATFSGHAHQFGHHQCTRTGVHFRVVEAILEAPPGQTAHAVVEVFPDRLELHGYGVVKGATLRFGVVPARKEIDENTSSTTLCNQ